MGLVHNSVRLHALVLAVLNVQVL